MGKTSVALYREPRTYELNTEQAWRFCGCCMGRGVCSGEAFETCSTWRIRVAEKAKKWNRIYKYKGYEITWSGINR